MQINRQGLKIWCRICPLGKVYCVWHNYVFEMLDFVVLLSITGLD